MQKNEGTIDRIIRVIVGIVILTMAYGSLSGMLQVIGYMVGVIVVFTAITGFCLLYRLLGIDTTK